MWTHKALRTAAALTTCLALSVNLTHGSNDAADAPTIAPVDQRWLTQTVRRTLAARLRGEPPEPVNYIPPALAGIECQVMVILREGGFERGIGTSERLPIVQAAQEAAAVALSSARAGSANDLESIDRIRIEMHALGPVVTYQADVNWTTPGALAGFIDPGVDGVRLFLDDEGRWFTPGEMISRCLSLEEAIRELSKEVTLDSRVLHEAELSRFRTTHWWEFDDAGHVVTLRRGMVTIRPEEVNRSGLDRAIRQLAEYIAYRQRPDGWFSPTFNPASDRYSFEDDAQMHSGACWALAEYVARTGDRASAEALARGLRAQEQRVVALAPADDAAFVAAQDLENHLGISAEFCLALAAHPDAERYQELRGRLVRGMLWLQREDGHFLTAFPPTQRLDLSESAAGSALLALVECCRLEPSAAIADALALAFPYYREVFARTQALGMAPWGAQAFGRLAELMRRQEYAEFVFELSDQVCARQLRPQNHAAAELWGAFADEQLAPGASTAAFVAGLADAAELARTRGDTQRFERYREACRWGARFILQLQFRPEECYYVRSLPDVVGGLRASPTNVRIHLNSCQHALLALMKCRDLLFPEQP